MHVWGLQRPQLFQGATEVSAVVFMIAGDIQDGAGEGTLRPGQASGTNIDITGQDHHVRVHAGRHEGFEFQVQIGEHV
ncbi:hypothetical protein D3C84_441910 [compost metagenome]